MFTFPWTLLNATEEPLTGVILTMYDISNSSYIYGNITADFPYEMTQYSTDGNGTGATFTQEFYLKNPPNGYYPRNGKFVLVNGGSGYEVNDKITLTLTNLSDPSPKMYAYVKSVS